MRPAIAPPPLSPKSNAKRLWLPISADLYLRLVEPESIKFTAGQFVNVEVPESREVRAYSMANPPSDRHHVELIVKLMPNGVFSSYLESELKLGDRLRLFGPLGQLKVRLSYRSILAIAGGSGMAPILSMLADLAEKGNARADHLSVWRTARTRSLFSGPA